MILGHQSLRKTSCFQNMAILVVGFNKSCALILELKTIWMGVACEWILGEVGWSKIEVVCATVR
jgi:hypothetical protein